MWRSLFAATIAPATSASTFTPPRASAAAGATSARHGCEPKRSCSAASPATVPGTPALIGPRRAERALNMSGFAAPGAASRKSSAQTPFVFASK